MCIVGKVHDTPLLRGGQGETGEWVGVGIAQGRASQCRTLDAAERSAASTAASASGTNAYLETKGNTVPDDPEEIVRFETRYECKAIGCKCRFCSRCAGHLGLKLRERLIPELRKWSKLMMLTLTIDPKLFNTPEEAYWYVRDKRAVAKLVKSLHQAGHLLSRRFFVVVEWHKNGWAHFHLLVEADRIPFKELAKVWGKFRPKTAPAWEGSYEGNLKGQSPEFGTVRFSKRDFQGAEHAAHYALKYMLKQPEQGYPDWVMDSKRQIRVFATSHLLLPSTRKKKQQRHPDTCFCSECRGEAKEVKPRKATTVRQRLGDCGVQAALIKVRYFIKANGEAMRGRPEFLCILPVNFKSSLQHVGIEFEGQRRVFIDNDELKQFRPMLHPKLVASLWPYQGSQLVRKRKEDQQWA